MLRLTQKFPYSGLPRFQKYVTSRHLTTTKHPHLQKPCPEPESDKKKEEKDHKRGGGGTGFYATLSILTAVTGATIAYAKHDPQFRLWLDQQLPGTDQFLAVLLQEDKSWADSFREAMQAFFEKVKALLRHQKGSSSSRETVCQDVIVKQKEYTAPRSVFSTLLNQKVDAPEENWSEIRVVAEPTAKVTRPNTEIVSGERPKKEEESNIDELPEAHPKNLVELEKAISKSATAAVTTYHEAVCAMREHNNDVFRLVEKSVTHADNKLWTDLKMKSQRKEKLIKKAEERAKEALENVEKLKDILSRDFETPEELKATSLRNINRISGEIDNAKHDLEVERRQLDMADKYWKKVEESRRHYLEELQTLFPEINITEREWNISTQELDLFLYYCFQNVLFYQKELYRLETLGQERLRKAVKSSGEKVDVHLMEAMIADEVDKERRSLEVDFQKRMLDLQRETELSLRQQLRRQAEAHMDHVCDMVEQREKELQREHIRREDEKMQMEHDKFKQQLAIMMGRLQGLEAALKARAFVDKSAHHGQVLWSASMALLTALRGADPSIPWREQLRPLDREINAIRRAALPDDELVMYVLEGMPKEATGRGVYTQEALQERFLMVERQARRMALVPDEGAPLLVYFLSYIQSLLLLRGANPIPQAELQDKPASLTCLSTYDVLERARYWMDRGNLEQTLRYMNLLKGASRIISKEWMDEVRILLETRQAANAIMAHACASGLLFI